MSFWNIYRKIECVLFFETNSKLFIKNTNKSLSTSCRIQVWMIFGLNRRHFHNELKNLCLRLSKTYSFERFWTNFHQKSIFPSNSALSSSTFLTYCQKQQTSLKNTYYWPKMSKKYLIIRHDLIDLHRNDLVKYTQFGTFFAKMLPKVNFPIK